MADSWIDKQGDVWTEGPDGLMHSYETAPFSREHVEKKWGPLRLVGEPAAPAPALERVAQVLAAHAPFVGPISGAWQCPDPCGASSTDRRSDGYPAGRQARAEEHHTHVAEALAAAGLLATTQGAGDGRDGVRALHVRREQPVFDEVDCAEGDCGHEPGTCVVVSPAVCAHCADQTAPDEPWEHAIREAAYWPCATIRALGEPADQQAVTEP